MKIIRDQMTRLELKEMAPHYFQDMVKAVVDLKREFIAVDAELHADLEQLLLEDGSKQGDLWGINFYTDLQGDDFVEFDSMINIRPAQNNRSRGVEDESLRKQIIKIVAQKVRA